MWKCLWLPLKKELAHNHQDCMQHRISKQKQSVEPLNKSWPVTKEKYNARVWFRLSGAGNRLNRNRGMQALLQKVWLGLVTWSHLRPILTFDRQLSKKPPHGFNLRQFRRRVALAGLNVGSLLVGGAWWCQSVKARNHFWRLTSHCISCSRKSQIWKFWQNSSETSFTLRHCCSTAALSLGQQPVSLWQLHRVQLFSLKITSFWPQNVFTVSRRQLKWIKCEVKSAPRPI